MLRQRRVLGVTLSKAVVIRNSDIQGVEDGITAPMSGFGPEAQLTIQNTYLRNWTNVNVPTTVGQRLLDGQQAGGHSGTPGSMRRQDGV